MTNKNAWRTGFTDFIFSRPCKSPFKGFMASNAYLQGFLAAQKNGLRFNQ